MPERERLESSLKDTADIASSPADQKIAEKLGLDVSQTEVEKAAGFVLTPAQRLEVEKSSERSRVQGSAAEKELRPNLKPAPVLDPRFYR